MESNDVVGGPWRKTTESGGGREEGRNLSKDTKRDGKAVGEILESHDGREKIFEFTMGFLRGILLRRLNDGWWRKRKRSRRRRDIDGLGRSCAIESIDERLLRRRRRLLCLLCR